MEVADTEVAVISGEATLAAATSVEVTSVEVIWAALTSAEAGPICILAGPTFTSPGTTASGIAAVGLAGMRVMVDSMARATRTEGCIRTATGRNELKKIGALSTHLASHEMTEIGRGIGQEILPMRIFRTFMRDAVGSTNVR
jgi:hypothetical protein